MAKVANKTRVKNITRNDLVQGTANSFIDIASDLGSNCAFYYDRLTVMIRMQLIESLTIVAFSEGESIGGVTLRFDWEEHAAFIESEGEFMPPDIINQYGTTDAITDTLDVVRRYISGLYENYPNPHVDVWYTKAGKALEELGEKRFHELMGTKPKSDEVRKKMNEEWAKIQRRKNEKDNNRISTIGQLPETSIRVW